MKGKDRKKAIICSLALIACNLNVTAAEFSSLGVKVGYNSSRFTGADIPGRKEGKGEVANNQCQARACARDKGLMLCADCDQFPCQKLRPLLADRYQLLMYVKGKSVTLEEYKMSAMQFESMPVLLRRLAEIGKLPSWVKGLV